MTDYTKSDYTTQSDNDFVTIDILNNDHADLLMNFESNIPITHYPMISNVTMKINNVSLDESCLELCDHSNDFGILEIALFKTKQTTLPIYLKLDIDTSASMYDYVSESNTKLSIVKKTIENMLYFIAEQSNLVIFIHVSTFDTFYKTIIPTTRVTIVNHKEIIEQINNIEPDGATNIEKTFLESRKIIEDYRIENPTHKIVYILLTDGNPTAGNTSKSYLKNIKPNALNKCIGYGSDHNASLLSSCGEYYFINDYENTGKIYGEILHKLVYPALENVEITLKNGLIYNSKKNLWESSIIENEMYSEQKRNFHIQINENEKIEYTISGRIVGHMDGELEEEFEPNDNRMIELYHTNEYPTCDDLRKYIFRQKTQELLFESIEYAKKKLAPESYKTKLNVFFKKMRSFMRNHDLLDDPFMNLLCDDIFVVFKTFGKKNAEMYTISRHHCQSSQTPCRTTSSQLNNDDDDLIRIRHNQNIFRTPVRNQMEIKETMTKTFDLYNNDNKLDFITGFDYNEDAKTMDDTFPIIDFDNNQNQDPSKNEDYDPDDLNYYTSQIQEDIYVRDSSIMHTMRQITGFGFTPSQDI